MGSLLIALLDKLRERQSWCPYCGGETTHEADCLLENLWFPWEIDNV